MHWGHSVSGWVCSPEPPARGASSTTNHALPKRCAVGRATDIAGHSQCYEEPRDRRRNTAGKLVHRTAFSRFEQMTHGENTQSILIYCVGSLPLCQFPASVVCSALEGFSLCVWVP